VNIRFGPEIAAAAAAHHLDPRLLAAIAAQETGGPGSNSGRNIVGDGGHGHGVFQIDDRFWPLARTPAVMNPAVNADLAATILGDNLRRFGGNVRAALSSYNAGSPTATGSLTRWSDGNVLGYADSVLRHYDALGGSAPQLAADTRESLAVVDRMRRFAAAAPHGEPGPGAPVVSGVAASSARACSATPWSSATASLASLPPPPVLQPMQSWTQICAAGSKEASEADQAAADLIDSGDVFEPAHNAEA